MGTLAGLALEHGMRKSKNFNSHVPFAFSALSQLQLQTATSHGQLDMVGMLLGQSAGGPYVSVMHHTGCSLYHRHATSSARVLCVQMEGKAHRP